MIMKTITVQTDRKGNGMYLDPEEHLCDWQQVKSKEIREAAASLS